MTDGLLGEAQCLPVGPRHPLPVACPPAVISQEQWPDTFTAAASTLIRRNLFFPPSVSVSELHKAHEDVVTVRASGVGVGGLEGRVKDGVAGADHMIPENTPLQHRVTVAVGVLTLSFLLCE